MEKLYDWTIYEYHVRERRMAPDRLLYYTSVMRVATAQILAGCLRSRVGSSIRPSTRNCSAPYSSAGSVLFAPYPTRDRHKDYAITRSATQSLDGKRWPDVFVGLKFIRQSQPRNNDARRAGLWVMDRNIVPPSGYIRMVLDSFLKGSCSSRIIRADARDGERYPQG